MSRAHTCPRLGDGGRNLCSWDQENFFKKEGEKGALRPCGRERVTSTSCRREQRGKRDCAPPWLLPRMSIYLMGAHLITREELRTDAGSGKGLCLTWETWLPRGLPEGLGAKPILSCYTSYHKWLQVFALACLSFQEHLGNGGSTRYQGLGNRIMCLVCL